ncbi:MAG: nicotinamide-nucleotide adenylyltransferase [Desulfurococcales archaeon]|nr:nicotinamide-nucleotide adenylyltransferase [Desulfurococcales archaeon]
MSGVRKYKRLVVPGRFQPPHQGHLATISQALELADEVIIVIGSAQDSFSIKNPLTAGERFMLLEKLLRSRFGADYCRRVKIVPVQDIAMNKVWVQYLRMLLPEFDGVVSGNQLVLMLFEDMGLAAIRPEMHRREECSGTRIRERILRGEDWLSCIPEEIVDDLKRIGFEERLRRLTIDG